MRTLAMSVRRYLMRRMLTDGVASGACPFGVQGSITNVTSLDAFPGSVQLGWIRLTRA